MKNRKLTRKEVRSIFKKALFAAINGCMYRVDRLEWNETTQCAQLCCESLSLPKHEVVLSESAMIKSPINYDAATGAWVCVIIKEGSDANKESACTVQLFALLPLINLVKNNDA